jgi:hypothetical protein
MAEIGVCHTSILAPAAPAAFHGGEAHGGWSGHIAGIVIQ